MVVQFGLASLLCFLLMALVFVGEVLRGKDNDSRMATKRALLLSFSGLCSIFAFLSFASWAFAGWLS